MPARESAIRRGTERGRAIARQLAGEAEATRLEHGTSYADLGRASGLGGGQVARICRGLSPDISIVRASQLLAVLGLELTARAFPGGRPVRDAAQLRLLDRFRARLSPDLRWRTEVPVREVREAGSVDRRAWDAGVDWLGEQLRLDAETHIGDLQAVQRRIALKQRDSEARSVVLLLADTRHHRALIRLAGDGLRNQFPIGQREALASLGAARPPGGNALVVL